MLFFVPQRVTLVVLFLAISLVTHAQVRELYNLEHDDRPYYFGLTVGYNRSTLGVIQHTNFASNPDFRRVEPHSSGGIELGLMATLRMPNEHWELRTVPKLIIGGSKYLSYYIKSTSDLNSNVGDNIYEDLGGIPSKIQDVKLPATTFSLPVHLKFSSDRINNLRVYVFAGPKLDINMSANAAEYKNAVLSGMYPPPNFRKSSLGGEVGLGFHFYMPFAVISPELRFASSLKNELLYDGGNIYSTALSRLQTQMVSFTINIEQ